MESNNPNPRDEVCCMEMNDHVKTRGAPDFTRDPRIVVFPKEIQRFARGALRWGVRDRAGLRPWLLRISSVHQLIGGFIC